MKCFDNIKLSTTGLPAGTLGIAVLKCAWNLSIEHPLKNISKRPLLALREKKGKIASLISNALAGEEH